MANKNENETVEQVCELTLDHAINHAQEAGDRLIKQAGCEACGREHHQLATWLRELKYCRNELAAKDAEIARLKSTSEVEKLKNCLRSAARWILTHDIYKNIGQEILDEAKKLLNDNGEFLLTPMKDG